MSGPGQTIGVSVFVDHFISDLGLTRSGVSTAYLIGTLTAAFALPQIGKRIDTVGVRTALIWIGWLFGLAVIAMSGVQGFVTLSIGFIAIRLLGQGSLGLASTVAVTLWFDKKRGTALGIFTTAWAVLMSMAPIALALAIDAVDWRMAWVLAGLSVWLVVVPIARFGIIARPSDVGQYPDGEPPADDADHHARVSFTRSQAVRRFRFWVLAAAAGAVSMLVTALNFHQISLLTEAGMTARTAAIMFLPQVVGAAVAGLLFGYLSDRLQGRWLIPLTMLLLAASLVQAAYVTPGLAIAYAVVLGAAGGASRSVTATLLPRWFGVDHIGSIQGLATFITVAASALGPVTYALARGWFDGYAGASLVLAAIPLVVGLVGLSLKPVDVSKMSVEAE